MQMIEFLWNVFVDTSTIVLLFLVQYNFAYDDTTWVAPDLPISVSPAPTGIPAAFQHVLLALNFSIQSSRILEPANTTLEGASSL